MALFGFFSGKNKTPHQLLAEGKLQPALKGFLELHKVKPDEPIFMVQIAEIYKKMGQEEKALPYYIKVGNHFFNKGFVNKAVASFKKALNISPENGEILDKLGKLNEEASGFMLNDSFFMKPHLESDDDSDEMFDITQEEVSLAEESLKLELEHASSEIGKLTLQTLPDFGFDGVKEKITEAAIQHKKEQESIALESKRKPEKEEDESIKAEEVIEEDESSKVVLTDDVSSEEGPAEEVRTVFKKRETSEPVKQAIPDKKMEFENLDDALEAAFSFSSMETQSPLPQQGLLNDPEQWTLFKGIDPETFMDIVRVLKNKTYEEGDFIIRQGEEGAEMFLIIEGQVEVTIQANETEKKVAILKSGDFFGEGAILTKSRRNASIKALEKTEVLTLGKNEFIVLVKTHPKILANMKLPYLNRTKINQSILGSQGS